MIRSGLLFSFFLAYCLMAYSQDSTIKLQQYANSQSQTLKIEVPFAQSLSYSKIRQMHQNLKAIEKQKIYHVDLVYTAFKESPEFDQEALNKSRMERLKKWLPQVEEDRADWTAFEQTGAQNREMAQTYFHGFVLHYGKKVNRSEFEEVVGSRAKPFSTITVDNQIGARLKYTTGSYLHIPKEAVLDAAGQSIDGTYQIHYREFRNEAEMALSGIPMFYNENGVEEVFNSVGMYEIRATSMSGDTLTLDQPIIVDFQCNEILPEVSFFSMNDAGQWKNEQPIDFPKDSVMMETMNFSMDLDLGHQISIHQYRPKGVIDQGGFQGYSRINKSMEIDKDQVYCMLNKKSWRKLTELRLNVDSIFAMVQAEDKEERGVIIPRLKAQGFLEAIIGESIDDMDIQRVRQTTVYRSGSPEGNGLLKNVLGDEPIPYAPGLVKGLESPDFGVYNCDQTKRIEDPVAIQPVYFDQATGQQLENLYSASVIDLSLNAALSYHPNHLVCNREGKTKILLFAENRDLYLFDEGDFDALPLKNGAIHLAVTNITKKVNNPSDLQRVLGI